MKNYIFLGVDISKNSIVVYDGKKLYKIPNERYLPKLKKLILQRFDKENLVLIYEPTGPYSAFFEEFCGIEGLKVVSLNPRKVPRLLEVIGHRAKTDGLDAKALYEYRKLVIEKEIKEMRLDEDIQRLSALVSEYRFLKRQRVNFLNYLEGMEFNPWGDERGRECIEEMICKVNERIKEIEEKIEELVNRRRELKEKVESIEKIEGIGFFTAVNLFLFFEKREIRNRGEVVALAGLDPIVYVSGKMKIKSRISKRGDSNLRSLLYMSGMCAIRVNEKIQEFFMRLVRNGKPRKVALVACMRKLLVIAFALYKNAQAKNFENFCCSTS